MTENVAPCTESTFEERFAEIFQVLETHGFGPEWQPLAKEITWDVSRELPKYKKSGPAALINCASGPIETVELGATTGVSSDEGPWETTRLVSFIVREGWANGWVPGLNRLSIHLDADRHWIGNDMGLGIIAQLDELAQQLRVPMIKLIRTRSSTNQRRTLEPSTDQQHVGDHQIEVVFDAGTPPDGVNIPDEIPASTWQPLTDETNPLHDNEIDSRSDL